MRDYVRAIVDHYDDGSGTLAVLEAWNEPNAEHRWADTPENLVKVHRIFTRKPVPPTVGCAWLDCRFRPATISITWNV